jgi:D-glycero-D-manno-heptose 1,7-bisphosphate phosphatase
MPAVMTSVEHLGDDGIWCQVVRPKAETALPGRPALFLDRDGVIIEDPGFLHRAEEMRLIAGAAQVIAAANQAGVPVVVLTNQSGIGRGYYGWADFAATQERLQDDLAAKGAAIDLVLACPYHPRGEPPYRHADHPCRKPRPGMLLRAAEYLDLDLSVSWIVGDRASDIQAGHAAQLAGGLHVLTGAGADERNIVAAGPAATRFEVRLANSILSALDLVETLQSAG